MLWSYFSQKFDTDIDGNQYLHLKIRALSPFRRKIMDCFSAGLSVLFTVLLSIEVLPAVFAEISPIYVLLVIPVGGGITYVVLSVFFILFLRNTKTIIISGKYVKVQRYMFFWSFFDRTRQLAFIEKSYSPLSNKGLEAELLREKHNKKEQAPLSKPYYKHSKKLIIEHKGIPHALMSIYDVGLAEQIRCRLQAALDEIPIGAPNKITGSPADIWGCQAGDLTDAL